MLIKQVSIKNFRSIQHQVFDTKALNVLVGNNDIGKSNFLKALNLFFNNETEVGTNFNFRNDFCAFPIVPKKKAPEVVIEITFRPPKTFEKSRDVVWRKAWRREGLVTNDRWYSDGSPLETRKKIGFWLGEIKYSYVPAIKGQDYFSRLLGDLHNVLSETIESELKNASENFIEKIRSHTESISNELFEKLKLKSSLQIPNDLSVLFEVLDFETSRKHGKISLKYRGDGIKVRHIPVILRFIGEQRNINRQKGAIKSSTIWGYEEPENNLELSKAFEQANDFFEYSDSLQIFLTTHSPAFYSLSGKDGRRIETFIIRPDSETNASVIQRFDSQNLTSLDYEMGLLPIITPHIETLIKDNEALLSEIQKKERELRAFNNDVLFVEGETDKAIIEKAFSIHAPQILESITVIAGNGANGVADMTLSWFYSRKNNIAVSLLDCDEAGRKAREKIDNATKNLVKRNFKILNLPKPPHLQPFFKKAITLPFSIEELFPPDILHHAKSKDWLEFKSELVSKHTDPELSFIDYCKLKLKLSEDDLLYLYKVKFVKKERFCRYVLSLKGNNFSSAFAPFQHLVEEVVKRISRREDKTETLVLDLEN